VENRGILRKSDERIPAAIVHFPKTGETITAERFRLAKRRKTMSNESPITRSIWPLLCQNPKLFGHSVCGPVSADAQKTLETLQEELDNMDSAFQVVESVTEFTDHYSKIEELRGKIGQIKGEISKLDTYASVYRDASSLIKAIRQIQSIGPEHYKAET